MMVVANGAKFTWNNIGSNEYKNTSSSSVNTALSKTLTAATITVTDENEEHTKRLNSLTDEEIIQKNLKELMDKKHQEERKANGRLVAVILASLVIFLTIYHAWIRNSGLLAGILVPAVIMLSFAAWVVILAKRDKARRQLFEKYLQEVASKNKQELQAKSKTKSKSKEKHTSKNAFLHYENEINSEELSVNHLSANGSEGSKSKDHRKHRKHRNPANSDTYSTTSSTTSSKKSAHYTTKHLRVKRPSIRQKLFRQTGITSHHMPTPTATATYALVQSIINTPNAQYMPSAVNEIPIQVHPKSLDTKSKRLQRFGGFTRAHNGSY